MENSYNVGIPITRDTVVREYCLPYDKILIGVAYDTRGQRVFMCHDHEDQAVRLPVL